VAITNGSHPVKLDVKWNLIGCDPMPPVLSAMRQYDFSSVYPRC